MNKTVRASAGNVEIESTHRCCAERALLDAWVTMATKNGVPSHSVVHWVRRKTRGYMRVERYVHGNVAGCCVPCILCRKELERFDMFVRCTLVQGDVFEGKLHEDSKAPPSRFTSMQRRFFSNCSDSDGYIHPRRGGR